MAREAIATDISSMPDVSRLARDVANTGIPRVLSENGRVLARLTRVRSRGRAGKVRTREELQQVLADTRGSWRGLIDIDEFKRQRRELQHDDREPRNL